MKKSTLLILLATIMMSITSCGNEVNEKLDKQSTEAVEQSTEAVEQSVSENLPNFQYTIESDEKTFNDFQNYIFASQAIIENYDPLYIEILNYMSNKYQQLNSDKNTVCIAEPVVLKIDESNNTAVILDNTTRWSIDDTLATAEDVQSTIGLISFDKQGDKEYTFKITDYIETITDVDASRLLAKNDIDFNKIKEQREDPFFQNSCFLSRLEILRAYRDANGLEYNVVDYFGNLVDIDKSLVDFILKAVTTTDNIKTVAFKPCVDADFNNKIIYQPVEYIDDIQYFDYTFTDGDELDTSNIIYITYERDLNNKIVKVETTINDQYHKELENDPTGYLTANQHKADSSIENENTFLKANLYYDGDKVTKIESIMDISDYYLGNEPEDITKFD